jgi:WD40 repeat protein
VYALGLTLYEMLAKRPAFDERDRARLIQRVTEAAPPPLRQLDRSVPRDLATIVHKAIERDPAHRYEDADALADDLRNFLEDRPVNARRVTTTERAYRWCRRNPLPAVLGLSFLSSLIGGLAFSAFLLNDRGRQRDAALAAEEFANRRLYMVRMDLLQRSWEEGNGSLFQRVLDEQRPENQGGVDRRGWEWHYWYRKSQVGHITLRGNVRGNAGRLLSVAFSPDGSRLAAGGGDGSVRVWDVASGQEVLTLHGVASRAKLPVAFSPDGARLAAAGEGWVRVWDLASGQEEARTLSGQADRFHSLAFSPDGSRLATAAGEGWVRVWDLASGQEVLTLSGQADRFQSVAFSPDGSRLAAAGTDGVVRVWDLATGQEARTLRGHTGTVRSVAFSPDGARLASSYGEAVRVWDLATGQESLTIMGNAGEVVSVAFSPDGARLAAAGVRATRVGEVITSDGERFPSVAPVGSVRVWDVATGQEALNLRGHTGPVVSVAFSPDGARLASAGTDGSVRVWDVATGREALNLRGHTGRVSSVVFSPDGARLASGGEDGWVRVWDPATGREALNLKAHTGPVVSVAFSPDGARLASGGGDGVRVWNLATGQEALTLEGRFGFTRAVAFSPDGARLSSAGPKGAVRVWDLATGREALTLRGHTDTGKGVAFSPDGARRAAGGEDGSVRVWDVATGQDALTLRGHTGRVSSLAFSPDGARLASGGEDGAVRVWDASDVTPESLAYDEARGWISFLMTRAVTEADLLDHLVSDKSRSPDVRKAAVKIAPAFWATRVRPKAEAIIEARFDRLLLREDVLASLQSEPVSETELLAICRALAKSWPEPADRCNEAAWKLVRPPDNSEADYRRGLRLAQIACRNVSDTWPRYWTYLRSLGVAQYRLGQLNEAWENLARSDAGVQRGDPVGPVFLTMAHHRLGRHAEAREMLRSLHGRVGPTPAPDLRSLVAEAEAVVLYDPIFPEQPFGP